MPYIPKSKIIKKYANEGELVYKQSGNPYKGNYIQTHDGKVFAGHENINVGPELEYASRLYKSNSGISGKKINAVGRINKYNVLKENIKKYIIGTKTPPNSKPHPKPDDYVKGFFRRYFVRRINGNHYIEVNKGVYRSLKSKIGLYDHNLYEFGFINWYLRGEVHKNNSHSIQLVAKKFPNLITIFPVLNEYQLQDINERLQENLNTDGGELYFVNGDEYIGAYHIHPLEGPMEGATHTDQNHSRLFYTNQLPSINNDTYSKFIENYSKLICYQCKMVNGYSNIVSFKYPKYKGCPKDWYTGELEASQNCI
jgi:hypothetical protein